MIWALHGFLGRPTDWAVLPVEHRAPELLAAPDLSMPEWASTFNRSTADGDVLIGYSMGGRLALHALVDAGRRGSPSYAAAVIVSAGLGVQGEHDRAARRLRDAAWAERFRHEEWEGVVAAWNAQPIFGGRASLRLEQDFDREALTRVLVGWSPAAHPPLHDELPLVDLPVLWVAGAADAAYVAVARRAAALLPHCEVWICPDAAHRVPWEQPEAFVDRVISFLKI